MKRIHKTASMALALLLICTAGIPAMATMAVKEVVGTPMPVSAGDLPDMNFSKLQISPRHSYTELMPGESEEITVTVTNKDNKTILVAPAVKDRPYNEYIFDETWVTVTPASAELKPDAEEEFTIAVTVPDDADRGHYGVQIAFTDDVMQTLYPMPYPNYINTFDLSVEVWKPPVIQIQPSDIYDRVESGKKYDYQINLKNIGEEDIEIDPKVGGERMYYGSRSTAQAFEDDAITIDAPSVVPAGGTVTVDLHLVVPVGAKGRYNGAIDLNIDDPSIDEWNSLVHLSFEVWTQPTEPFVKTFTAETTAPITIYIVSNQYRYGMSAGGSSSDEQPSFDVTLREPDGDATPDLTMVTYHGSVDLGGNTVSPYLPPGAVGDSGIYHEGHTSYIERYTANGAAGDWTLGVLPHYAEEFSYTITIGDAD
ncbi:MAG: hypothetical protein U9N07_01150 [Euryarchaeota archaeon]|nr:hypothetical protein [Euryarchaeota archaeon]